MNNEEKVKLLSIICREFQAEGRYDLMLQGIGGANLERLCVEAARAGIGKWNFRLCIKHCIFFF